MIRSKHKWTFPSVTDGVTEQIQQFVESNESASMLFVQRALHERMRAHPSSVNATCASES